MLELTRITKTFGSFTALKDVSLQVRAGEIRGLLGENGAGKTTLMNVVSGLLQADSGEVHVGGAAAVATGAGRTNLGMVHQHFLLVPSMTVAENLSLGRHGAGLLYSRMKAEEEVRALGEEYGLRLDPGALVGTLPLGFRQRVEILKALKTRPRVLILDEPTAVLTPQESDELAGILRKLAAGGMAVIFISHKQREVLSLCHSVTVLRKGALVKTLDIKEVTEESLARLLTGASEGEGSSRPEAPVKRSPPDQGGREVLGLEDLWMETLAGSPGLQGLSLSVRAWEIVALVGIEGNGQAELEDLLGGIRLPKRGRAQIGRLSPRQARAEGRLLAFVPGDRERTGLISSMDILDNFALSREGRPSLGLGLLDRPRQALRAQNLISKFDVRCRGLRDKAGTLSGGNKQKLVLARELAENPPVVSVFHPTRGLDFSAASAVLNLLRQSRDRGAGILMVTAELDEAMELADRLFVLWRGRIQEADRDRGRTGLGALMLGEGFDE